MTQIVLDIPELYTQRLKNAAEFRRKTIEETVLYAIRKLIETDEQYENDPLFSDNAVFDGDAPQDLARNHDTYLYGEEYDIH